MIAKVGVFKVAEVPTNWYEYLIPQSFSILSVLYLNPKSFVFSTQKIVCAKTKKPATPIKRHFENNKILLLPFMFCKSNKMYMLVFLLIIVVPRELVFLHAIMRIWVKDEFLQVFSVRYGECQLSFPQPPDLKHLTMY